MQTSKKVCFVFLHPGKFIPRIIKGNAPGFAFLLTKALKKHNVMDLQIIKLPLLKCKSSKCCVLRKN